MNTQETQAYLDGRVLIAMPGMMDKRFRRSVIYVCAHSDDGAMGLIVNQIAPNISYPELFDQLGITNSDDSIRLPERFINEKIFIGGPVESGRGFVLHSADYFAESSTLPIAENLCLTSTTDILKAMADGSGPRECMLALGYSGWSAGQLEDEIRANGWLLGDASADLIFATPNDQKYEAALRAIGIDPAMLSAHAGEA